MDEQHGGDDLTWKPPVGSSENFLKNRPLLNTVMCLVTWPLNESEAGVDHVMIQPSLLFSVMMLFSRIYMRKSNEVSIKTRSFLASLSFIGQVNQAHICKVDCFAFIPTCSRCILWAADSNNWIGTNRLRVNIKKERLTGVCLHKNAP